MPEAYALFGGDHARQTLEGWKAWLGHNNATVMAVVLLVLGVKIVGDGFGGV